MVKGVISVMLVLLLAGCSETVSPPTQKAQRARITPQTTLNMAQLCKDQRLSAITRKRSSLT